MALTEELRAELLSAKLEAIVRAELDPALPVARLHRLHVGEGDDPTATVRYPLRGSAALRTPDGHAYVLVQDDADRGLGAALAWAARHAASSLTCVVDVSRDGAPQDAAAAVLARRVGGLDRPVPVFVVDGASLRMATPAAIVPGPFAVSPAVEPFLPMAAAAGVEVVPHADGSATFEVLGLEVGRVEVGPGGTGRLRVGAGHHDREATDELFMGTPTAEALLRAADTVRRGRTADAQAGPANLLQRERWLRLALVADPSPLGVRDLRAVPEPAFAPDLRRPRPAAARAGETLVVCSAGIDLDLIPTAADAIVHAPDVTRVVVAVPDGDDHQITRDLLPRLGRPSQLVTVTPPWAISRQDEKADGDA